MFQSRQIKTKLPDERKPPKTMRGMREEHRRQMELGCGNTTRGQETGFSKNTTHNMDGYMLATIGAMFSSSVFINTHAGVLYW